jgi:hypothetical protein
MKKLYLFHTQITIKKLVPKRNPEFQRNELHGRKQTETGNHLKFCDENPGSEMPLLN